MVSSTKLKVLAAAVALAMTAGTAFAVPVGDLCGNKYISLEQDGAALSPTICSPGNSTGSGSPITAAGWTDGAELQGSALTPSGSILGALGLSADKSTGAWSITNPSLYPMLGISIKQGNGFAFYILDLTKALSGFYFTGNNPSPTGHDVSHINAWYKGTPPPPPPVPVPAAGLLLLGALGGLAALRRRKRAA